jgi:hypothetical protein
MCHTYIFVFQAFESEEFCFTARSASKNTIFLLNFPIHSKLGLNQRSKKKKNVTWGKVCVSEVQKKCHVLFERLIFKILFFSQLKLI